MIALNCRLARSFSALTVLATLLLVPVTGAWAQSDVSKQIVGVWKLVSDSNTGTDGVKKMGAAWGTNPLGKIIFTSSGHFISLNTRAEIPKFASGNRMQGTADENKAVVQSSLASEGTYSVSADGKVLIQKIEACTWPGWAGTEQKRNITMISKDEFKWTLVASIGGTSELTYRRIK